MQQEMQQNATRDICQSVNFLVLSIAIDHNLLELTFNSGMVQRVFWFFLVSLLISRGSFAQKIATLEVDLTKSYEWFITCQPKLI